jgi:hypothetical protein
MLRRRLEKSSDENDDKSIQSNYQPPNPHQLTASEYRNQKEKF